MIMWAKWVVCCAAKESHIDTDRIIDVSLETDHERFVSIFLFHYHLTSMWFDTLYSEVVTASLNKTRTNKQTKQKAVFFILLCGLNWREPYSNLAGPDTLPWSQPWFWTTVIPVACQFYFFLNFQTFSPYFVPSLPSPGTESLAVIFWISSGCWCGDAVGWGTALQAGRSRFRLLWCHWKFSLI